MGEQHSVNDVVSRVMDQGRHGEQITCLPNMSDQQNSDLARQITDERRNTHNPDFLPGLKITMTDGGLHVKSKDGACEANSAGHTADEIQKGPKDAKTVIGKINNITNESERQQVLEEIKHRPNEFPNIKVVGEHGGEPRPGDKLVAVPFDQKQVSDTWRQINTDLQKAGEQRQRDESARLQRMREHPEETAHKLEELAKRGQGTSGDQKAESDYRKGMDDLRKLPPDIQQKVIGAMVADNTVPTEVHGNQVIQNGDIAARRSVVDMDKSYGQQAEEARQEYIANTTRALEAGAPNSSAAPIYLRQLAQQRNDAGSVEGDKKMWFNY